MPLMGEVEVDHGSFELGMPQVPLNEARIDTSFEQMGGVRMPKGMDGDTSFGNAGPLGGGTEGALDTGPTHRGGCGRTLSLIAPCGGKKPGPGAVGFPVGTEQRESIGGQRDVPVFGALATMDMDQEARAIDIRDLEAEGCMQAEAQAIDGGEVDLVVEGGRRGKEPPHLLHTEDGGETVGGWCTHKRERVPVTLEDVLIEEADATVAETHRRRGEAIDIFSVQKVVLQFLFSKAVRGFVVELSQQVDFTNIGLLGALCLATHL